MDAHIRIDVNGESTVLAPWQTAVTPATARIVTLVPGGEETVAALIVRPDPDLEMIRGRAIHAGCSSAAVDAFFAQFPWPHTG